MSNTPNRVDDESDIVERSRHSCATAPCSPRDPNITPPLCLPYPRSDRQLPVHVRRGQGQAGSWLDQHSACWRMRLCGFGSDMQLHSGHRGESVSRTMSSICFGLRQIGRGVDTGEDGMCDAIRVVSRQPRLGSFSTPYF